MTKKRTTIVCEFLGRRDTVIRVSILPSGEYIAESQCESCHGWTEFCRSERKMAYLVKDALGRDLVQCTPALDLRRLRKTCSPACKHWHRNKGRKAKQTFELTESK
jgi:hypothetical protein